MGGIVGVASEIMSQRPCIEFAIRISANDLPLLCGAKYKTPV